jgi:hypothetical protein
MLAARQAGAAGILCFVLILAAFLVAPLWDLPPTSASGAEIAGYTHDHRGQLIAAMLVYGLAMALFLFFAAGLCAWLKGREPAPGVLSTAFGFGAVSLTTTVFAGFVAFCVLIYRVPDPAVARPLYDLTFGLLAFSGLPTAVALGAYAALVIPDRALPPWTGWLACLAAVAHVAIAASFAFSSGFLSLEGAAIVVIPTTLFAWVLATGVALFRAAAEPAAAR